MNCDWMPRGLHITDWNGSDCDTGPLSLDGHIFSHVWTYICQLLFLLAVGTMCTWTTTPRITVIDGNG